MRRHGGEFRFAGEEELSTVLSRRKQEAIAALERESENYLAQVNEQDFVGHLASKFALDIPRIDFDGLTVDHDERQIPADRFPPGYMVSRGKSYPKPVVIYQIPFTGDGNLLRYQASSWLSFQPHVYIKGGYICFDIVAFNPNDPAPIKRDADSILDAIRQQYGFLLRDLEGFNNGLAYDLIQAFRARKQRFLEKNSLLANLGVPVRKRDDVPPTFAVPASRQPSRIIFPKPEVHEPGFRPEPTLPAGIYQEILKIINDAGKNWERYPSTYQGKGEEDLRDQLLFILQPNFQIEGSATGESFNKAGKTDILIKWQSHNAFVAECKFWGGAKKYLETISQLLGYLTWRDSKAAVIIFDQNKNVSAALQAIEASTQDHPNYLSTVGKNDEGWFSYRFHIDGDRNREVQLAVLVFHLPK